MIYLVVVQPFGEHAVGDVINDPETVDAVLAEHGSKVVRVEGDNTTAPEPAKEG